jgi:hypothetical protein
MMTGLRRGGGPFEEVAVDMPMIGMRDRFVEGLPQPRYVNVIRGISGAPKLTL